MVCSPQTNPFFTAHTAMRHWTITLTMDTYGHLFPDQRADAVLKLQDMLASGDSDLTQVRKATGTYGTAPEAGEARSA
ncbi:MAG: hypothetical protein NTY19_44090 [Planctomycetota bacterium]|nr:hypothetical protein [Planctomycetota bacterium]